MRLIVTASNDDLTEMYTHDFNIKLLNKTYYIVPHNNPPNFLSNLTRLDIMEGKFIEYTLPGYSDPDGD